MSPLVPFDTAEQAELTAGAAELLPHTGEIRRKGSGTVWATVAGASAVPCLVALTASGGNPIADAPSGAERQGAARIDVLPAVDLRAGDRVMVWSLGRRFEVELVAPPGVMFRTGYGRLEEI